MSADSLYHAFGLKGYSVHGIRRQNDEIVLEARQPRESLRCPACGGSRVFSQGHSSRRFRTLPIGTQPVVIELAVPRVRCRDCGLVRQVKIPFAPGSRRYTKAFERYALELARIKQPIPLLNNILEVRYQPLDVFGLQLLHRHVGGWGRFTVAFVGWCVRSGPVADFATIAFTKQDDRVLLKGA